MKINTSICLPCGAFCETGTAHREEVSLRVIQKLVGLERQGARLAVQTHLEDGSSMMNSFLQCGC